MRSGCFASRRGADHLRLVAVSQRSMRGLVNACGVAYHAEPGQHVPSIPRTARSHGNWHVMGTRAAQVKGFAAVAATKAPPVSNHDTVVAAIPEYVGHSSKMVVIHRHIVGRALCVVTLSFPGNRLRSGRCGCHSSSRGGRLLDLIFRLSFSCDS